MSRISASLAAAGLLAGAALGGWAFKPTPAPPEPAAIVWHDPVEAEYSAALARALVFPVMRHELGDQP